MSNDAGTSALDKAVPPLRVDELNELSSRYDHIVAAPPDEDLVKYWYIWTVLASACGIFSFVVFLSILTNRKVLKKPFNLYLIYLMIPDFTFSLLCALTCLLNALNGAYWSHWMCNFQQFYVVFGIGANAWLNCIIAHQLHMILQHSSTRRRYKLPTRRRVTFHAVAVYLWCFFLGSWGIYEAENFPFHSGQASGLACLPLEGSDKASSIFFWVCFFPLFVGIPIAGVVWICWNIFFRKLMPPPGRRRLFTIYFGRLIIVFLVMWIPTLLLMFFFAPWAPQWVDFFGGAWSHLQGGLSALLVLLKPDIMEAFQKFIRCRGHVKDESTENDSQQLTSGFSSSGRMSSGRLSSGLRGSYWWPRRLSGRSSDQVQSRSSDQGLIQAESAGCCVDLEGGSKDGKLGNDCRSDEIMLQNDEFSDCSHSKDEVSILPESADYCIQLELKLNDDLENDSKEDTSSDTAIG